MGNVIECLSKNPLLIAIFQIIFGAWLLQLWSKHRDQTNSRRLETIKFIEETANLLNDAISNLFFIVHNRDSSNLDEFQLQVDHLFKKRFGIRVKSQALMRSRDFSKNYEIIMHQLDNCIKALEQFGQTQSIEETVKTIESAIPASDLDDFKLWANAEGNPSPPWGHFYIYAEWIWSSSDYLLTKALDSAMKSKRKFKLEFKGFLQQRYPIKK